MPEQAYFVYVMGSLSRTLFTGVTNDLRKEPGFYARHAWNDRIGLYSGVRKSLCVDPSTEPALRE